MVVRDFFTSEDALVALLQGALPTATRLRSRIQSILQEHNSKNGDLKGAIEPAADAPRIRISAVGLVVKDAHADGHIADTSLSSKPETSPPEVLATAQTTTQALGFSSALEALPLEVRVNIYSFLGLGTKFPLRGVTYKGTLKHPSNIYQLPCRHLFKTGDASPTVCSHQHGGSSVDMAAISCLMRASKQICGEIRELLYHSSFLSIKLPDWKCDTAPLIGRVRAGKALLDAVITDMPLKYFERLVVSVETMNRFTHDPLDLLADMMILLWYLKEEAQTRLRSLVFILPQLSPYDKHKHDLKMNTVMSMVAIKEQSVWLCEDLVNYLQVDGGLSEFIIGGLDSSFVKLAVNKDTKKEDIFEQVLKVVKMWMVQGGGGGHTGPVVQVLGALPV